MLQEISVVAKTSNMGKNNTVANTVVTRSSTETKTNTVDRTSSVANKFFLAIIILWS